MRWAMGDGRWARKRAVIPWLLKQSCCVQLGTHGIRDEVVQQVNWQCFFVMCRNPNNPQKTSREGSYMTADSGLDGVQGGGARDRKDQHAKGVKCHQNSCAGSWFRLSAVSNTFFSIAWFRPRSGHSSTGNECLIEEVSPPVPEIL